MSYLMRSVIAGMFALVLAALSTVARAAAFDGKTITIIVGFGAGGGYDAYARLAGRHFGKFVPGRPNVVIQNKPGGSSATAAAYLYGSARKDGTELGILNSNLALAKVLGETTPFDVTRFTFIGRLVQSINVALVASDAPATDVQGAMEKEVILAASGVSSATTRIPLAFNRLMGTRFKVLRGYESSRKMLHAMEQGEVHGVGGTSYDAVRRGLRHWLEAGRIRFLWATSLTRDRNLPDVPTAAELARTDEQRRVLRLLTSPSSFGRVIWGPPGLESGALRTLQEAFAAMIRDAAFLADASKRKLEIDPASGDEVREIMRTIADAPESLLRQARRVSEP